MRLNQIAAIALALTSQLKAEEITGESWFFQVPEHRHLSGSGTPLVHAFRSEPAFNHRDLFLDYSFRSGDDGDEHEIEFELEWALTERFGLIVEQPYVIEEDAEGFGDFAIVPRVLLVKKTRFLLAANLEIGLPTGESDLGFGEEVSLAPSVSSWWDLGNWWTLHSQFGWERGLDSGEEELFGSLGFIHTFGRKQHEAHGRCDVERQHLEPGLLSLVLELNAITALDGDERGDLHAEGVAGFYYGLSEDLDVRIGYQFPLTSPREFNSGLTLGLVRHF